MRNLASIQKINKLEPIEGADRIEIAHVLGWQCVVKKGDFSEGDKVIYFEPDSFLPVRTEFEFLRKSCYKKTDYMGEGFLIGSKRIKGQLSQGLVIPMFPSLTSFEIGENVSDILGVKKFEIEERATEQGTIIGRLPQGVPHTEETRIQAEPNLISAFGELVYYITTKLDGSSHSVSNDSNGFHVCGHNYEYSSGSFYDYIMARRLDRVVDYGIVIQGEFCGPGIQKNRLHLLKPEWYVFTIIENGRRVSMERMLHLCGQFRLKHVPIEETDVCLYEKYPTVEALLERVKKDTEGIVIRPT